MDCKYLLDELFSHEQSTLHGFMITIYLKMD